MATLVAIGYPDEATAERARETVQRLESELIIQADQVAAVSRDAEGKYHVHTTHGGASAGAGAMWGGFWGMLFGLLFFMPFLGAAFGAAVGALGGHFADYGVGKEFIEQVRNKVKEGTSALFLLLGQVTTDRVVEAFKAGPKFEIIASNLSHEQEEKLKAAFAS